MRTIRKGIFETNSSSSHAFVIRTDELIEQLDDGMYYTHDEMMNSMRIRNGCYQPKNDDWYFGRAPFRALDTFELKFQYAYANSDVAQRDNLVKLLYELIPEIRSIKVPKYAGVDDYPLYPWLNQYGITMREFLTNRKYIVIQDGDEYCIWDDLIHSGLIDLNAIENKKEVKYDDR